MDARRDWKQINEEAAAKSRVIAVIEKHLAENLSEEFKDRLREMLKLLRMPRVDPSAARTDRLEDSDNDGG